MARVPVPLIGPSNTARAIGQDPEQTINFYPERSLNGAKAPVALLNTPGIIEIGRFDDDGIDRPWRGKIVMDDRLFVVSGSGIWEIYPTTTYDNRRLWASLSTISGKVGMSANAGSIIIGDGTGFYLLDLVADTLTPILAQGTDPIRGFYSQFIDQTTLFLERNTGRVYYSDVGDPGTVQGASFFEAEALPDDANCMLVHQQVIYVGGPRSIQPFYDSGDANNPYAPVGSAFIPLGVAAPGTFQAFDNGIMFVAQNDDGTGRVMLIRSPGDTGTRISTHAVESAIGRAPDITALTAFVYGEEGHLFYVLNLDVTSWAYDAATGVWSERAVLSEITGEWERIRPEHHAFVFGQHIVSDYATGQYYQQSLTTYIDAGHPIVRRRRFAFDSQGQRLAHDELQIDMKVGVGLDGVGAGTDPKIMLRYSDDGGRTWSYEIEREIGRIGETFTQVTFPRLGTSRDRVYEVSFSDPVEIQLLRAWAKVRVRGG